MKIDRFENITVKSDQGQTKGEESWKKVFSLRCSRQNGEGQPTFPSVTVTITGLYVIGRALSTMKGIHILVTYRTGPGGLCRILPHEIGWVYRSWKMCFGMCMCVSVYN